MNQRTFTLIFALALLALVTGPARALGGSVEARGEIVDAEGNPVVGAVVAFATKADPDTEYTAKTNKKGRYFISGMYNPGPENDWIYRVTAEGLVPVKVIIESRTANRVLVGDVRTVQVKYQQKMPSVMIRPLGQAKLDFTLDAEETVKASAYAEAQAVAAAEGGENKPQAPQRDPWDEALQLASTGDYESAVPFFEEAIDKKPKEAERREAFAKVLYQMERLDEAAEQARAATELDPGSAGSHMVLYSIAVSQDDLDGAHGALLAAREVAPQDTRVLEQLAYVAERQGDAAAAVSSYVTITEVDPNNAKAWMSLGGLYASQGDSEKSEAAYQRVTELEPDDAHQIFYNIGALIINKSDRSDVETEKAISAFRKAIEIKPDYAQAHKQLAFALLGVGDRSGARNSLEHYIKAAPNAPDASRMQELVKTLQ